MSEAESKRRWCLQKAEKEMRELGRHKGLLKIPTDKVAAQKHLAKAQHNFDFAYYAGNGGYSDWSASAFFYSIYHCCLALVAAFGYESKNQECTIALLSTLREEGKLDLDQKFLKALSLAKEKDVELSVIGKREEFQYGTQLELKRGEFETLAALAKEMIEVTKSILFF